MRAQRAPSSDVPPCSVAVAVQERDHSDMLMNQRGSSERGLARFKRQLPAPFSSHALLSTSISLLPSLRPDTGASNLILKKKKKPKRFLLIRQDSAIRRTRVNPGHESMQDKGVS